MMPLKDPSVPGVRTLMTGLMFGESPRWHDGRFWVSDWVAHEVIAVDLEGKSEVVVREPSIPLCFDFLPDGRLVIMSGRRILRLEPDGSLATHADRTGLSELGWNEIVVDGRGNAYVNAAGFGLMGGHDFVPGSIAVVSADGSARQVADGVAFPNGMAVTPDNSTLIVAESYGRKLTAFDIEVDGGLSNRRVWADLGDGVPQQEARQRQTTAGFERSIPTVQSVPPTSQQFPSRSDAGRQTRDVRKAARAKQSRRPPRVQPPI